MIASLSLFVTSKSQNLNELTQEDADVLLKNYRLNNQPKIILHDSLNKWRSRNFSIMSKKPGVYKLPQDGMPCIVPDTKDIAAIPNAFKGTSAIPYTGNPPHIPNPALGDLGLPLIIPDSKK